MNHSIDSYLVRHLPSVGIQVVGYQSFHNFSFGETYKHEMMKSNRNEYK